MVRGLGFFVWGEVILGFFYLFDVWIDFDVGEVEICLFVVIIIW